MPRYTEAITIYMGYHDQVRAEVVVDYFITPGRPASYFQPGDGAELEVEAISVTQVVVCSANGEETVLPDEFMLKWMPLFMKRVRDCVESRDEDLFHLADGW